MTSLALHGVRGGLGRSALLAALGHALQGVGERVLLVDLCPSNLLGLHFNLPLDTREGWALAEREGRPYSDAMYEVLDGLCLMPFGNLPAGTRPPLHDAEAWRARQAELAEHFDWLLFDLPQLPAGAADQSVDTDVRVLVAEAEMASHLLLGRRQVEHYDLLLVNRYDPASRLQSDLLMVWRDLFRDRLPIQVVHRDEAFLEALACKAPLGHYAPQSLACRDVQSLAVRCLTRRQS
ncbi:MULTISPECIES: cellulose biosynthesis protein BcsQ [Pseudomonas]|uniref:Cellulose synthase operon protein YhjQ n=1 Tax=Pseudomonas putida TaxID=303 RepID=A0A3M8TEW2_PSEPU|nr:MULTISPECIES: cellulose biosynthesis protein BcsQ [Pseudomonas]MCE0851206.1 cellulose synthase operon protein YhjQ [Pseudomonas asiatica]MCO6690249.1 cellulose synthase operon protein YhjQ [Pseudomonas shirazica]RNF89680.1 cellulose synthase operon protein YhjQ [Pseudomonas putida]